MLGNPLERGGPCPSSPPLALEQQHLEQIMSDQVIDLWGASARSRCCSAGGKRKRAGEGLQHQHLQHLAVRPELCFLPLPSKDQGGIKNP